ncbi:UDP-3-O-(3-hydroxymyristoyl)glucosamine N-acyltransferase [Vibrio pelagius]|uniref:UDP-3-O-(3-hydroxymyristoyl)glucosamine N-acyltransferase n=1 Tax=Vibrio pelagius TaxID=28169 RepID=UPI0021C4C111|nr:UDP-3-O-(3-hydroxymyristoyl)glucosamine N-acyltransferase [Vibrio pelagius]
MLTVSEISLVLGGVVEGDASAIVSRISSIAQSTEECAAIVISQKDEKKLSETKAAVVIGPAAVRLAPAKTKIILNKLDVDKLNDLLRYYRVNKYQLFDQDNTSEKPDVYIGKHCSIGENCHFGPGVIIMNGVTIGNNVAINANSVIKEGTVIGNNVTIDSNNSIGNFSFEYMTGKHSRYERVESVGRVIIEDNAELGCNNTIDRGTLGDTIIGRGTKIDNQVQIGHDCQLGENCLIVSQVGLAGHTIFGHGVIAQGQVGTAGNIKIGDNSIIKAKSGVSRSFPANSDLFGYPAKDSKSYFKNLAALDALTKARSNKKVQQEPEKKGLLQRLFGR